MGRRSRSGRLRKVDPRRTGVVVMAYGSPAGPDDIEAYYTHIRRGRPPSPEQLEALIERYRAVGGISRMAERTEAQRSRLADELEQRFPGRFRVATGQRHASPFIADAVRSLAQPTDGSEGCEQLVGLVLAPHYSGYSVGHYGDELARAADQHGLPVTTIPHWYDLEAHHRFLVDAVRDALSGGEVSSTKVVFTAHSLPERLLVDDPYPDQLQAGAEAVARSLGLEAGADWSIAWQSAGATDDLWRGPDIGEVIDDLAGDGETERVVVCPHGFIADHLEVAHDLDIEVRKIATDRGLLFERTRVLNDDPAVFAALAERVVEVAGEPSWPSS